ncbi:MAG: hypothetical protein R3B96_19195 [Pirellulaceae bacterium]
MLELESAAGLESANFPFGDQLGELINRDTQILGGIFQGNQVRHQTAPEGHDTEEK